MASHYDTMNYYHYMNTNHYEQYCAKKLLLSYY